MTAGLAAKKWIKGTLQDLVFFQRGFDITQAQQTPGSVPVISSSGVTSFHNEARARGPGVVIGRKGTLGSVHYSEVDYWPHDTTLWSKDLRGNNPRFVYFYLHTVDFKRFDVGNSNPTLNRNHIHGLPALIPPPDTQTSIAEMLAAYEDLIENNRRRMALLEDAARQLYREWFVRLHFPGREHTRISAGVPEGWRGIRFEEVLCDLESGGRPRGGAKDGEGIPSIGAENVLGIGRYDYTKEKYVSEEFFEQMTRGIVRNRDVALYKDGANIGRASYFGEGFPHEKCAVNEHVFILRSRPNVGQNFLYFWMTLAENRQAIANLNANTAQPGISQEKLKSLDILLPAERLLRAFNEAVEPQVRQIFVLALMNRKLSVARDLLLPRLVSGEIAT